MRCLLNRIFWLLGQIILILTCFFGFGLLLALHTYDRSHEYRIIIGLRNHFFSDGLSMSFLKEMLLETSRTATFQNILYNLNCSIWYNDFQSLLWYWTILITTGFGRDCDHFRKRYITLLLVFLIESRFLKGFLHHFQRSSRRNFVGNATFQTSCLLNEIIHSKIRPNNKTCKQLPNTN